MRIGSMVKTIRMKDGEWYVPEDSRQGTVIAIESNDFPDGYEQITSVVIRWEDGHVEGTRLNGEDEAGEWEIADATPEVYANLYLWDRAYGGPEEGGWWYDTYTPADGDWNEEPPRHGHFATPEEAEAALVALREWCERENATRRHPSSVASEGHFQAKLEAWPAERMPWRRPHYC